MLSHNDLSASLAAHLAGDNRMVWEDMQLGPSGSPRPDVYTVMRSFSNPNPMAYECKVSRADFLSDVTTGKWQIYLNYAYGVVFACEDDLLKKSDIPGHCGLIVLRNELTPVRWRMAKRPVINPTTIPQEALLKLLIDGVAREGPRCRARYWSDSMLSVNLAKKFGDVVSLTVRDRMAVEHEIEYAKRSAEYIVKDAEKMAEMTRQKARESLGPLHSEIASILGLSPECSVYDMRHEVDKLREDSRCHPAVQKHRALTLMVRSALERAGWVEEKLPDDEL